MAKTFVKATRDNIDRLEAELDYELAASKARKNQVREERLRRHKRDLPLDVAIDPEFADMLDIL